MEPRSLPPHVSFPDGPAGHPCPACEGTRPRRFYEVLGIPVHSCVLPETPEAARAFPTGDLCLAHCPDCGFIYNDLFRAERLDYSEDYEESQGCSATFRAFLDQTADTLVQRTGLAGELALEVGCGRGDFLAALLERGAERAVGIDPSATAGQAPGPGGARLELRRKAYSAADFDLQPHLVACRHTLEHLPAVSLFLGTVRAHLDPRVTAGQDAWLFVEVPDVLRVLREGAFWDIYHEHCSYFTAGSLGRLAAQSGFTTAQLELVYGGQYLQLTARAAGHRERAAAPKDDLPELAAALKSFRSTCAATLERLGQLLEQAGPGGTCLWGAGSKATGLLSTLGAADYVSAVVDIDPAKQGRYCAGSGLPILAPADLPARDPALVLVMNPIYLDEIRADLDRLGIQAPVEAV